MALGRFEARIISRKPATGRPVSIIAAAAYRATSRLIDGRDGAVHDYRRKAGCVHREILLPTGAAPWLADRERLWNHVEAIEKRIDAQLARELILSLPHELAADQNAALVRDYLMAHVVSEGMVADWALHVPVAARGDDPRNVHAHVLLTLRRAHDGGLCSVKTRAWNSRDMLKAWRANWQDCVNRALGQAHATSRIDLRTNTVQLAEAQARRDRIAIVRLSREKEEPMGRYGLRRAERLFADGLARCASVRPDTDASAAESNRLSERDAAAIAPVVRTVQAVRRNTHTTVALAERYHRRQVGLLALIERWQRLAARKALEEERDERRGRFDRLSMAHALYRLGLASRAQVLAADLEVQAMLTAEQRADRQQRLEQRLRRLSARKTMLARQTGMRRARRRTDP